MSLSPEETRCRRMPIPTTTDVAAVLEAKSRGVGVLCTAHGGTFQELLRREGMGRLFEGRTFQRYVRLVGCGAVDEIRDEEGTVL